MSGVWQTPRDYTYRACTTLVGGTAQMLSPAPGSTLPGASATFTWSAGGAGTDAYWLDVGNAIGSGDLSAGQTTATSRTVSGLPCDGRTLYVRLWTRMNGVWQTPRDYIYRACTAQ